MGGDQAARAQLPDQPGTGRRQRRRKRLAPRHAYLGRRVRREVGRHRVAAIHLEHPVQHAREALVVELGARHARHPHQVLAPALDLGEEPDEAVEPRHVPGRPLAPKAVTALAAEREVGTRAGVGLERGTGLVVGRGGRHRRSQAQSQGGGAHHALPITTWLEQ